MTDPVSAIPSIRQKLDKIVEDRMLHGGPPVTVLFAGLTTACGCRREIQLRGDVLPHTYIVPMASAVSDMSMHWQGAITETRAFRLLKIDRVKIFDGSLVMYGHYIEARSGAKHKEERVPDEEMPQEVHE